MLALASAVSAGEMTEAAMAGNAAKVQELLAKGVPADGDGKGPTPLSCALSRGHAEVALALASHGGTADLSWLNFHETKITPPCLRAVRLVVRRADRQQAWAAAGLGPEAASEVLPWLDAESTPQEREAALLAFRRVAGNDSAALSALAARDDSYETLGWNGVATPDVVRRLALGVAEARDDALSACLRVRWPKAPDDATKEAITDLRQALGTAREKGRRKDVDDIVLALAWKGPDVASHPLGRVARRSVIGRGTAEEKAVEAGLRWLAKQFGGTPWHKWMDQVRKQIVPNQLEGPDAGSWPAVDPWARDGGRAYATAMMVLVLETPYRYGRAKGAR